MKTVEEITKILREADPIKLFTGKPEFQPPQDEYAPEARSIHKAMAIQGDRPYSLDAMASCVHDVFEHWFWKGCISRHDAIAVAKRLMP